MRILGIGKFYPPEYLGGLETAVATLNRGIVRRGEEASCVVCAVRGPTRAETVDGVRVVRVRSHGTVLSQPVAPGLVAAVRREPGDLVHLHHPNPAGDLAAVLDRARPLVVTQHSDIVRQRALRALYAPVLARAYGRARFVVVASEQLLAASRELAPYREKARVIPYGIETARFAASPETTRRAASLRASWGPEPVVLAVGRLVGYKGFDVLVEAMRGLDARLVVVGQGPEEDRLKALAGADARVVLAGRVAEAELPAYYHAADLFCLPSLTMAEAFGIVLLEAMACGKPLVTTALPTGVSAVNRDGQTGLVVPPGDAGALRDALRALLGDERRRLSMGLSAKMVLDREYTAALMADRYLTLYRETLGGGR